MFTFIELTSFSRVRDDYFDDDGFAEFQRHLASHPGAGDVIPETGGGARSAGPAPAAASAAACG